jgi:hypothetical protein
MQVVPVPADESVLRGVCEPQGRVPGGRGVFPSTLLLDWV